jgi:DNA-binding GntR family transcriptional regulator
MDAESVRDNSEIFGMVYGFIGRRAAERRTPELQQRLTSIADPLAEATRPEEVWRLAEAYLDTIVQFGAASRLAQALRRMRTLAVDNLFEVVPESVEITRTGTLALISAILEGDGDRVESEQRDMQRRSAELVVKSFAARGILGDGDGDVELGKSAEGDRA